MISQNFSSQTEYFSILIPIEDLCFFKFTLGVDGLNDLNQKIQYIVDGMSLWKMNS